MFPEKTEMHPKPFFQKGIVNKLSDIGNKNVITTLIVQE